jgi:uncharacterized membrane protein
VWVIVAVGFVPVYLVFGCAIPYAGYRWFGVAGLVVGAVFEALVVVLVVRAVRSRRFREWTEREERGRSRPIDFSRPIWRRFIP